MRVAVLGAGPIGLEAAAAAGRAGLDVFVLEATGRVGGAPASWPHVRWYTPWSMNTTAFGRETVGLSAALDECPTGEELTRQYLQPLARWLDVRLHHRVLGLAPWDITNPSAGFRLLVHTPSGETWMAADTILDCRGCPVPNSTGPSGLPAPCESAVTAKGLLQFGPVATTGMEGRRILLVGDGLDAARVARDLDALSPRPLISWIGPLTPGEFSPSDDDLPERRALRDTAIEVSRRSDRWSHAAVDRYRIADDGRVEVRVSTGDTLSVDAVIACTGFHPEGPIAPPDPARRWLTLGARGSAATGDFLLQTGLAGVEAVIATLATSQSG